jgi:4-hydroxy-2-oxoheptanedioate aldolase
MSLHRRLHGGEPLVGTVLALPDVALAELGAAPFDLVWIDLEHGALGLREMQELTIAVQRAGCAAAVRLPRWDADRLPAVLDAGPDAVVVPAMESAAHARELAARLRYPPDGARGYGPRRAGDYGRGTAEPPACIVQIETRRGVTDAPEIAAVPGVDALVAGCADLSFALGAPHALDTADMRTAVAEIGDAARDAGIAFGVAGGGTPEQLAALGGVQATLLVHSVDMRLYARAMDAVAARLRAALAAAPEEVRRVRA